MQPTSQPGVAELPCVCLSPPAYWPLRDRDDLHWTLPQRRWSPRPRSSMSSIIGGGPAGYAAALRGGLAGLNIAVVEKEKVGGTCLHRGCIPAKEFLETATRLPDGHRAPRSSASPSTLRRSSSPSPRPASRRSSISSGGVCRGLMKRRKITTFIGTGTLGPDHVVRVDDGTELVGNARHPGFRLGAPQHPGLRGRRRPGPDLRRGARPRAAAGVGGGDRRRRHRLRVRLHAGRPGHPGDRAGGPAQDPARLRQGRGRRGAAVVQEAGHRGPHRCHGDRPHAERRRPVHDRPLRRRRRRHRRRRGGLGRAAGRCRTTSAWKAPRCRSTAAASSRSTSTCEPASRACSPPATWSTRRPWPTSGSPRRS